MTLTRTFFWSAPAIVLGCAIGCGSQDPNRGEVTGIVTVNGQPAVTGAVAFSPVDGQSPTSGGKIIDGKYTVTASTGTSRVAIRVPKVVGKRKLYNTPDSPEQPLMAETLPPEYNDRTTLTLEVKPGDNEHNFELQTK
ncbi:hypothetical protein [Lacipirellula parvula]|uniref:Carboxypeptidase regulatory-like domain-containing protein n=1 Tax=Lacipirellula parvula TaxID=2650471 RepID=A0A5K7XLK5_9BACT|nr:hypothetical protein [Lacipirellula parvula]BBO33819.1 hypothetical protein PLANPX_3431 [Lacipirellula parvula]